MPQSIGHGSKFEIESPTPGTYTEIAGVMDIQRGSNKVDAVETTDMQTSGNKRTYTGGLENSGEYTVKINAKPPDATQTYLYTCRDGALHNMKVILPGAVETESFSGLITSIDKSIPDDKLPTLTIKVQISGAVTIT